MPLARHDDNSSPDNHLKNGDAMIILPMIGDAGRQPQLEAVRTGAAEDGLVLALLLSMLFWLLLALALLS
jgi:hypothetical protein